MDKIINILLLVIIFVFDPLAISLVIAANYAFDKAKPKKNLYGEDEDDLFDDLDDGIEIEPDLEDLPNLDVDNAQEVKPTKELIKQPDKAQKNIENSSQKLKEKTVTRVLQKTPSKRRVEFNDGSTGWINKGDENKIVYL